MIVSTRQLAMLLDGELPPAGELFDGLTAMGLEGEARTSVRELAAGMVAARVAAIAAIPETGLKRAELDLGGGQTAVVLTAEPTVATDETIAYAPPGTRAGELEVGVRTMAGHESFGMLLSRGELGVGGDFGRAWRVEAAPGTPLGELLDDDELLDFGVTPDRGDLLSHLGVAREVALRWGLPLRLPALAAIPTDHGNARIELPDADCSYYMGVWFELDGELPATPPAVEALLGRCGMRCVHPLVDLSNYVMLELGQPTHAFDADKVQGTVSVRTATAGETIETLDGEVRELVGGELVVVDAAGPIAIAGVMGGARTEVDATTRRVLLESAHFAPARVMRSRRPHGLSSEASQRFERGVDPAGAERGAARFLQLVGELVAVTIRGVHRAGTEPEPATVEWDRDRALRLLGALPDETRCAAILDGLGFVSVAGGGDARVVPSWRFDVQAGTVDLSEEVARVWGYEHFEPTLPRSQATAPPAPGGFAYRRRLLDELVGLGFMQAIHMSFAGRTDGAAVRLANPMGEQTAALRQNLRDGLLAAAAANHRRQQPNLRLAEIGKVFRADGTRVAEAWRLGLLWSGAADPRAWADSRTADFYDLKGVVERVLAAVGVHEPLVWRAGLEAPVIFHPVRVAALARGDTPLGWLGELDPAQLDALDLSAPTVVAELELGPLWQAVGHAPVPQATDLPRYPKSERDLALVVDRELPAADLLDVLRTAAGQLAESATVFDVYEGPGIAAGRRSVAVRLGFRAADRTLSHEDVEAAVARAVDAAVATFGAELRGS